MGVLWGERGKGLCAVKARWIGDVLWDERGVESWGYARWTRGGMGVYYGVNGGGGWKIGGVRAGSAVEMGCFNGYAKG